MYPMDLGSIYIFKIMNLTPKHSLLMIMIGLFSIKLRSRSNDWPMDGCDAMCKWAGVQICCFHQFASIYIGPVRKLRDLDVLVYLSWQGKVFLNLVINMKRPNHFHMPTGYFFSTRDSTPVPANLFRMFLSTEFWWMFGFITVSGISKERIIKYWYGFADFSLGKPILIKDSCHKMAWINYVFNLIYLSSPWYSSKLETTSVEHNIIDTKMQRNILVK